MMESAHAFTSNVSREVALNGPDKDKWAAADNLEKSQLEKMQTWDVITKEDL